MKDLIKSKSKKIKRNAIVNGEVHEDTLEVVKRHKKRKNREIYNEEKESNSCQIYETNGSEAHEESLEVLKRHKKRKNHDINNQEKESKNDKVSKTKDSEVHKDTLEVSKRNKKRKNHQIDNQEEESKNDKVSKATDSEVHKNMLEVVKRNKKRKNHEIDNEEKESVNCKNVENNILSTTNNIEHVNSKNGVKNEDSDSNNSEPKLEVDSLKVKTKNIIDEPSDSFDLMLNITSEPITEAPKIKKICNRIPKHKRRKLQKAIESDEMIRIGDSESKSTKNEKTENGVKLCFKNLKQDGFVPHWLTAPTVEKAKKSYKHMISGDIEVTFKNCNLHKIKGYGTKD